MPKKLLIEAKNIEVTFKEQTVLDFDRFYLYEGEKVGLVGINGAGKTTLLKVLSGELEPTRGSVKIYCTPFYFQQFGDGLSSEDADYAEAGRILLGEEE